MHGNLHAKFLPKEWVVLYKKDAQNKCIHRIWDCRYPWVKARKLYRDAPIEVYIGDGSWAQVNWQEVVTHCFVKSPIGLVPPHGYARRDNYSMHTMEWILLKEKVLQERNGNEGLRIQHAQSDCREKNVPLCSPYFLLASDCSLWSFIVAFAFTLVMVVAVQLHWRML